MTPREVGWRLEWLAKQRQDAQERTAQLAAWVLTPFIGKSLEVSDFLKRPGEEKTGNWADAFL